MCQFLLLCIKFNQIEIIPLFAVFDPFLAIFREWILVNTEPILKVLPGLCPGI